MKRFNQILILIAACFAVNFFSCKDLDKPEPIVPKTPKALFSFPTTKIYQGCNVKFSNTSINATTYAWDFGDGQSSTEKEPAHVFNSPGSFMVKLKATSGSDIDEVSLKIDIYQNQKKEKSYPVSGTGYLESGVLGSDGIHYLLGNENSNIVLKKINADLVEVWSKPYDNNGLDTGEDIITTHDGNLLILGTTQNNTDGEHDILLIKVDNDGKEIWRKSKDLLGRQWASSVILTKDNGFLIAGYDASKNSADLFVIKTDEVGNTQNSYNPSTVFDEKATDVIATNDGGYIITGYRLTNSGQQLMVVKLDGNLKEQWGGPKFFDGSEAGAIINTPDNGFLIVGSKIGSSVPSLYILKIDSNGEKTFSDIFTQIQAPQYDGNFVDVIINENTYCIVASSFKPTGSISKAYFLKLDVNNFNKVKEKEYNEADNDSYNFRKIFKTSDCGFAFYGNKKGANSDEFYLVKTDAEGNTK